MSTVPNATTLKLYQMLRKMRFSLRINTHIICLVQQETHRAAREKENKISVHMIKKKSCSPFCWCMLLYPEHFSPTSFCLFDVTCMNHWQWFLLIHRKKFIIIFLEYQTHQSHVKY